MIQATDAANLSLEDMLKMEEYIQEYLNK